MAVLMYRHQVGMLPALFSNYFLVNAVIHDHNTRYRQNYRSEVCRINVRYFSVRVKGPQLWNSINTNIRESHSLIAFKSTYKNYLIDLYWLHSLSIVGHSNSCVSLSHTFGHIRSQYILLMEYSIANIIIMGMTR